MSCNPQARSYVVFGWAVKRYFRNLEDARKYADECLSKHIDVKVVSYHPSQRKTVADKIRETFAR